MRSVNEQARQFGLDELTDLISNPAIVFQGFIFRQSRFGQFWRIVEPDVNDAGLAQKCRAVLVGMAANGYNQVKWHVGERVGQFRTLAGNVNTCFSHHLDSVGVHAVGFYACRIWFNPVAKQMPGPTFCHLATTRIPGAQENDFGFHWVQITLR